MEAFFNPRSIAIIGASKDFTSISGKPIKYLLSHGYEGKIFPVNPKYKEIGSLQCYPSVLDIPEPVDMALVAINYKRVLPVLEQCHEKGIKFAIIFSSGFAEAGEEGKRLQEEITALARRTGMRVLGPNCQGLVNLQKNITACFSASLENKPLVPGRTGFVTQSGALGYSIFNMAQEMGVGFSFIVSTGNEVDIHSLELLEYMVEHPDTDLLVAYLEGIKDGKLFRKVAGRALELGKPIVSLKVGRSEVGQKAASSHTASLTGSDKVVDAFFKQNGIIRVDDIQDITDIAGLFSKIPTPIGKGLGIVTTSGGAGILAADTAVELGLEVPELTEETRMKISKVIPDYGSAMNPVDVTAQVINDPEGFMNVLDAMLDSPDIDALVIVVTMIYGGAGERLARDIVDVYKRAQKPIALCWTAGDRLMENCFAILRKGEVPYFKSPVRCVKALGALMRYGAFRRSWLESKDALAQVGAAVEAEAAPAVREFLTACDSRLTEHQGKELLSRYGIPVTAEKVAATEEQAVAIASEIGYPVAVKVDSPDILHKTEAGALKLFIKNEEELKAAFHEVLTNARSYNPGARINGALIQEMVQGGTEVIVGINNDPQFGPVVIFGLGGIFVEILKDVSMRVAPFSYEEALAMIREIRGYGVLAGARGQSRKDIASLADVLVKVSRMAVELEDEIRELDINPLLVLPEGQGVKVADALVIRKEG